MQAVVADWLKTMHLEDFAKASFWTLRYVGRRLSGWNGKITDKYLRNHPVRKLHIGCGANLLKGWLNSDYHPRSREVLYLDARANFSFENDQFDYIFSEHIIEHLTYLDGLKMLKECYRVLKPDGKVRVATPDLSFLINLYRDEKSELQREYIKWAIDKDVKFALTYDTAFLINNFVRDWGHQFIYDERVLRCSLEKAGFIRIAKHALNDSDDEELRRLENENRLPNGFLRLETLVLEGTKPSVPGH